MSYTGNGCMQLSWLLYTETVCPVMMPRFGERLASMVGEVRPASTSLRRMRRPRSPEAVLGRADASPRAASFISFALSNSQGQASEVPEGWITCSQACDLKAMTRILMSWQTQQPPSRAGTRRRPNDSNTGVNSQALDLVNIEALYLRYLLLTTALHDSPAVLQRQCAATYRSGPTISKQAMQ